MALGPKQQAAFDNLRQRRQAGNLGASGLARLQRLRSLNQPVQTGGSLRQQGEIQTGGPLLQPSQNQVRTGGPLRQEDPANPAPRRGRRGGSRGPGFPDSRRGFTMTRNPGRRIPEKSRDSLGTIWEEFGQQFDGAMENAFNPMNFDSLPEAPNTEDLAAERQRIEGDLYNKYTEGFGQQKSQDLEALKQEMAERGIQPGSGELYTNTMRDFEENWNDRYDEAKQNSIAQGGAEWQRAFGIGSAGRSNALGEQTLSRQFPLEQLQGLMGMGAQMGNLSLQYAQMRQQRRQAKKDREQAMEIAKMAAANRGGGGGYLPQEENLDIFDPAAYGMPF